MNNKKSGVRGLCLNSNYLRYNKVIAKFLSVHSAVMIGILWEIENNVIQHNEKRFLEKGEWFTATQDYVFAFSSLKPKDQREAILQLKEVGFIEKRNFAGNRSQYKINWDIIMDKMGEWIDQLKKDKWRPIKKYSEVEIEESQLNEDMNDY